jgi:NAD(P)-dependent dehydrogenase (short-subunit alcohol dehydrogenase family)
MRSVIETADDVDILVNMAGGTDHHRPFAELTDDDWRQQWDFNLLSGVRLSRHYVPKF